MRGIGLAAALALGGVGCGTDCRAECEKAADELRTVFGIENPCTGAAWDQGDSCEDCDRILQEQYAIVPQTSLCDAEE